MNQKKLAAKTSRTLLIVSLLMGATVTYAQSMQPAVQLPAEPATGVTAAGESMGPIIEDAIGVGGVGSRTGVDEVPLAALNMGLKLPASAYPSAIVANGQSILESLESAETVTERFTFAASLAGVPSTPGSAVRASLTLEAEILSLYARLGAPAGPAELAALQASAAKLDASTATGLADLVESVNQGIDAARIGGTVQMVQAAANVLATVESLRSLQGGGHTTMSSPTDLSCAPFQDPNQFVIVGGPCNDTYPATENHIIQVDLGGNDVYLNNAGGANRADLKPNAMPANLRDNAPVAVSVDLGGGSDLYQSDRAFVQGAALFESIGILFDDGGDDDYISTASVGGAQGMAANFGIGILVDLSGNDTYTAASHAQGSGDGGFLFDLGTGDDDYSAGTASQGGRILPFPAGLLPSILFDAAGNDEYALQGIGQGAGNYLVDGAGDDSYTVVGTPHAALTDGFAQGVGFVTSTGLLVDGSGNDHYTSDIYASQGFTVGDNVGALLDFGTGSDQYVATGRAQGICETAGGASTALLFDGGGADTYVAGAGQGSSRGLCAAFLIDAGAENDAYDGGQGSQGVAFQVNAAAPPQLGLLLDAGGDDTYSAGDHSQGSGTVGVGILIDASGTNQYSTESPAGTTSVVTTTPPSTVVTVTGNNPHCGEGGPFTDAACTTTITTTSSTTYTNTTGSFFGASSQGAGTNGGLGLLLDRLAGESPGAAQSSFEAGGNSQGSGTSSGVGLLISNRGDGATFDAIGSTASVTTTKVTTVTTTVINKKQTETSTSTTTTVSTSSSSITADHSQGSGQDAGTGILVNREGNDAYTAGNASQGSAVNGAIGVFLDQSGDDSYSVSGPSISRGFGDSTPTNIAIGLFVDGGGSDAYTGGTQNDACESKGAAGLTVDTNLPALPPSCVGPIADTLVALQGAAEAVAEKVVADTVATVEGVVDTVLGVVDTVVGLVTGTVGGVQGPNPCDGSEYFCDDMESTDCDPASFNVNTHACGSWTVTTGGTATVGVVGAGVPRASQWHIVNQSVLKQPFGPNAHSGERYWYAGFLGAPGVGYGSFVNTTVTSPTINLTSATSPVLNASLAGTSEFDFDFLTVSVINETNAVSVLARFSEARTILGELLDGAPSSTLVPAYFQFVSALPDGFGAGHTIQVRFAFTSDSTLEDGQGWNVDDVIVEESA